MQTAYELLKDHPQFSEMNFELEPLIREHLHCSSDVPSHIDETIEAAKRLFPNLNRCPDKISQVFSSYKDSQRWYIEDQLPELTASIAACIEQCGGDIGQGVFTR
jgi:hypothetical protein